LIYASWIDTHFGPLIAFSKEKALCLLTFAKAPNLQKELERFAFKIAVGKPDPISMIEKELSLYFSGTLKTFRTPYSFEFGTPFQRRVWEELAKIPYGKTRTYGEMAAAVGNAKASRAVGGANGANPLAILIPCHRVINSGNKIGGYAGGQEWKRWLLEREGYTQDDSKISR
jgi:O-6-methylguanine DNA methyltransferase